MPSADIRLTSRTAVASERTWNRDLLDILYDDDDVPARLPRPPRGLAARARASDTARLSALAMRDSVTVGSPRRTRAMRPVAPCDTSDESSGGADGSRPGGGVRHRGVGNDRNDGVGFSSGDGGPSRGVRGNRGARGVEGDASSPPPRSTSSTGAGASRRRRRAPYYERHKMQRGPGRLTADALKGAASRERDAAAGGRNDDDFGANFRRKYALSVDVPPRGGGGPGDEGGPEPERASSQGRSRRGRGGGKAPPRCAHPLLVHAMVGDPDWAPDDAQARLILWQYLFLARDAARADTGPLRGARWDAVRLFVGMCVAGEDGNGDGSGNQSPRAPRSPSQRGRGRGLGDGDPEAQSLRARLDLAVEAYDQAVDDTPGGDGPRAGALAADEAEVFRGQIASASEQDLGVLLDRYLAAADAAGTDVAAALGLEEPLVDMRAHVSPGGAARTPPPSTTVPAPPAASSPGSQPPLPSPGSPWRNGAVPPISSLSANLPRSQRDAIERAKVRERDLLQQQKSAMSPALRRSRHATRRNQSHMSAAGSSAARVYMGGSFSPRHLPPSPVIVPEGVDTLHKVARKRGKAAGRSAVMATRDRTRAHPVVPRTAAAAESSGGGNGDSASPRQPTQQRAGTPPGALGTSALRARTAGTSRTHLGDAARSEDMGAARPMTTSAVLQPRRGAQDPGRGADSEATSAPEDEPGRGEGQLVDPGSVLRGKNRASQSRGSASASASGRRSVHFSDGAEPGGEDGVGDRDRGGAGESRGGRRSVAAAAEFRRPAEAEGAENPSWLGAFDGGFSSSPRGTLPGRVVNRAPPPGGHAEASGSAGSRRSMPSRGSMVSRGSTLSRGSMLLSRGSALGSARDWAPTASSPDPGASDSGLSASGSQYNDDRSRRRRAAQELIDVLTGTPTSAVSPLPPRTSHGATLPRGDVGYASLWDSQHSEFDERRRRSESRGVSRGTSRGSNVSFRTAASLPRTLAEAAGEDIAENEDEMREWARRALQSAPSKAPSFDKDAIQRRLNDIASASTVPEQSIGEW